MTDFKKSLQAKRNSLRIRKGLVKEVPVAQIEDKCLKGGQPSTRLQDIKMRNGRVELKMLNLNGSHLRKSQVSWAMRKELSAMESKRRKI